MSLVNDKKTLIIKSRCFLVGKAPTVRFV